MLVYLFIYWRASVASETVLGMDNAKSGMHRFQVPRKLRGSHGILLYQSATHGSSDCLLSATEIHRFQRGSQGNWAYQSATYRIPHRPIDCTEFPTKCSRLSADN